VRGVREGFCRLPGILNLWRSLNVIASLKRRAAPAGTGH
jgi:hypothetical protein